MRILKNERGVAMVTVLFVAAVLTVTASAAAFVSVQDLRANHDDRRAGRALAVAESGIDRTIQWLRSYRKPWKQLVMAGSGANCLYPANTLTGLDGQGGSYTAVIEPLQTSTNPSNDNCPLTTPSVKSTVPMKIEVTGTLPSAVRVLRQEIRVSPSGIPVGLSANTMDANGNPNFTSMSVIASGVVNGRRKMDFSGTDPYYDKSDFYPCVPSCEAEGDMPAALHSADRVYTQGGTLEHPPSPNCNADKSGKESTWDGSNLGTTITGGCLDASNQAPPTAKFTAADIARIAPTPRLSAEDHNFFKSVAQSGGLYCNMMVSPTVCTKTTSTGVTTYTNVNSISAAMIAGLGNYFIVYVEWAPGTDPFRNTISFSPNMPSCSSNSATNQMVVLILKNGSIRFTGGGQLTGAIFAEDGAVDANGNYTVEGTVVAKDMRLRGNPTYKMTQCWLDNAPGTFFQVEAGRWYELDQ